MKISLGISYIYVIYAFYMGTPILSELKHQTSVETSEGGSLQLAHENQNAHLKATEFSHCLWKALVTNTTITWSCLECHIVCLRCVRTQRHSGLQKGLYCCICRSCLWGRDQKQRYSKSFSIPPAHKKQHSDLLFIN